MIPTGESQTAYQVIVASSQTNINNNVGDKWDSGKVTSPEQNAVKYNGSALASKTTYYWKVRTWDKDNNGSSYSAAGTFETAMLNGSDWIATWIGGDFNLLRKDFTLPGKSISQARAYITSLGYNELRINGQKIGGYVLNPGFTKYGKRALYNTYDVTSVLNTTNNAVGIMLGNAYYGNLDKPGLPISGDYMNTNQLKALFQLEVKFTDGTSQTIVSDSTWRALKGGPITYNHIFNGERYDARNELPGWDSYGYNQSAWAAVSTFSVGVTKTAQLDGIKVIETFTPVAISQPQAGVYVIDTGQLVTGWLQLTVNGAAGTQVSMHYSEILYANGMINPENLRTAQATDKYTLKGSGTEVWEPRFTYHGFRYVEVTGFPGAPALSNFKVRVVHSDIGLENTITSSNLMLNKVQNMYRWSQRGNLMSVPTDTMSRDERQGWGGDAVVTAEAALYNFDMLRLYSKWFNDIDDSQKTNSSIPATVPDFHDVGTDTAWMAIRVLIPWDFYQASGDKLILEKHYAKMKSYLNYLDANDGGNYLGVPMAWGDWLAPVSTSTSLIGATYYYRTAWIMSQIATILGYTSDASTFTTLANNIKNAFNNQWLINGDHYDNNTQCANSLPLYFDMAPETNRAAVVASLVNDIQARSNHLSTGILGTKAVMEALWKNGRSDLAYSLAVQNTYPSWGYMVDMGATTIWEHWEYITSGGMNSHSHVMFGGGVGTWAYKSVAGIAVTKPGYEEVQIKPEVNGDLTSAGGTINSVRGTVATSWTKGTNRFDLNLTIPVNCKATVYIPTFRGVNPQISEGGTNIWSNGAVTGSVTGVSYKTTEGDYVVWNVGSGTYSFVMTNQGTATPTPSPAPTPDPNAITYLADNFDDNSIDTAKWDVIDKGLESTAASGLTASETSSQFRVNGTTSVNYWAGKTLRSKGYFNPTAGSPLTVDLDRVSLSGSGTAYRSSIWLWKSDTQYIHVGHNIGENNWQYNKDGVTGQGTQIWNDANTGLKHLKLVHDGDSIHITIDGVERADVPVAWNSGFRVMITGQARASGDTVTAIFDNLTASISGVATPTPTPTGTVAPTATPTPTARTYTNLYDSGSHSAVQLSGSNTAGAQFAAANSFDILEVCCPSWSNNIGNLTLKLFAWNTNYATSVGGTALASQEFVNFTDNAWLRLTFTAQPAGTYVWQLSNPVETVGVWKVDGSAHPSVAYLNGTTTTGDYESWIYYLTGPTPTPTPTPAATATPTPTPTPAATATPTATRRLPRHLRRLRRSLITLMPVNPPARTLIICRRVPPVVRVRKVGIPEGTRATLRPVPGSPMT